MKTKSTYAYMQRKYLNKTLNNPVNQLNNPLKEKNYLTLFSSNKRYFYIKRKYIYREINVNSKYKN